MRIRFKHPTRFLRHCPPSFFAHFLPELVLSVFRLVPDFFGVVVVAERRAIGVGSGSAAAPTGSRNGGGKG